MSRLQLAVVKALAVVRTGWAWLVGALATVGLTLPALAISTIPACRLTVHRMARLWGRACIWGTGCRLVVDGADRIDPGGRYVLMANHQSALDIPVLMGVLPADWRCVFWAKESLFRVPVLGWAMRMLGHMPIDRVNRLSAASMLADTRRLVADGRSVLVFPEETYGPGDRLLPFQRGGFVVAVRTGLPVLPVALTGTRSALSPRSRMLSPTTLRVRFGDPISTRDLSVSDRPALVEQTRAAIERLRDQSLAEPPRPA